MAGWLMMSCSCFGAPATWLLEAKLLIEADALPGREIRPQAEVRKEARELRQEPQTFELQRVTRWQAQDGVYLDRDDNSMEYGRLLANFVH